MTEETIVAHGSDKGLIHREERAFNLPRKKNGEHYWKKLSMHTTREYTNSQHAPEAGSAPSLVKSEARKFQPHSNAKCPALEQFIVDEGEE